MKKRLSETPIEKVYIVVLALLGILYMIFLPPFRVSDEYRHFNRAYEVTMGQIISKSEAPRGSQVLAEGETKYATVLANRDINMQTDREKEDNAVASGYSPVSYLPASIGIFIARFFTENLLVLVYVARISSFLCTLWILYQAVKYMPFGKNLFIAITLLPISIQEFVTVSSDSLVIALTLAMISFTFYERKTAREDPEASMSWQEIAAMFLMAIMLGQCKYIYVFLSAIYLWIPKERFAGMKRKIAYAASLIVVTGLTMAMWLLATNVVKLGGSVSQTVGTSDRAGNLLHVLAGTISYNWKIFIASATADSLGDLDIHPSKLLVVLFVLLLIYIIFAENKKTEELTLPLRLSFIGLACLELAALLFTFIHEGYVNEEFHAVIGIQGRYFIPMMAPMSIGISLTGSRLQCPQIPERYLALLMGAMNLLVVYAVFAACR